MSFAGHVLDMINRDAYNRSLRQNHRKKSRAALEKHYEKLNLYQGELMQDRKIPREEVEKIKAQIREEMAADRKSALVKSLVLTAVVIAMIVLSVYLLSQGEEG